VYEHKMKSSIIQGFCGGKIAARKILDCFLYYLSSTRWKHCG